MDFDSNSMDISVTESENYTPRHNYNTRLSAKLSNSSLQKLQILKVEKRLVLEDPGFDRFLVPKRSSGFRKFSFDGDEVLGSTAVMGWQERTYTCNAGCTVNGVRPQTCTRPYSEQNYSWNKYSKFIFIGALVGMIILPTLNNIFQAFNQLTGDIEELKKESRNTRLKLQNMDDTITNVKKSSYNLHSMVIDEVEKYTTDKTGRTDFALESSGGKIITLLPGTENLNKPRNLFGMTICEESHGPRALITPGSAPGQCWAFRGGSGGVILKLLAPIDIEAISLEHISKQMSPTGEISTAPKDFIVLALRSPDDPQGSYLGQFQYSTEGPTIQTFPVKSTYPVEYLSFKVLSNHGNPDFTCVYRLRVHGALMKHPSSKK